MQIFEIMSRGKCYCRVYKDDKTIKKMYYDYKKFYESLQIPFKGTYAIFHYGKLGYFKGYSITLF